ncbi:MAG: hypothetical protein GX801_02285 [Fibrobacter sp.]|nr:hypothetical protein [Fibrobacter sp.]
MWRLALFLIVILNACKINNPATEALFPSAPSFSFSHEKQIYSNGDTIKLYPENDLNFKVSTKPDTVLELLDFKWHLNQTRLSNKPSVSYHFNFYDIGLWKLKLDVQDSLENTKNFTFYILINTPPTMSKKDYSYSPFHLSNVDLDTTTFLKFAWEAFDPDPKENLLYKLQIQDAEKDIFVQELSNLELYRVKKDVFSPNQKYRWRVIVNDFWNYADTSTWLEFSTNNNIEDKK